jgi:inositol polyphosphate-4-phosphatase
LAETLGYCKEQHRSNLDNFDRLKRYCSMYKKIPQPGDDQRIFALRKSCLLSDKEYEEHAVKDLFTLMEDLLRVNCSKNIRVLHCAEDITRALNGMRVTSCKSAKDRTAMAVTLEQTRVLQQEFHLPKRNLQNVLDIIRAEGTRLDNTMKNIGKRKYAFSLPQIISLPQEYRPPSDTSYARLQT